MSTMNAAVGQSRSNQQGRDSARKVIAAYRKSAGLPHDLSFDEIADENLKSLTTSICFWLSARAIPSMGFDEQLQPIHPGNNRCLVPSTLVQYVGYWLVDVRVQFPQHADFQESLADTTGRKPTTPWWTDMRSGFLKAAQKFQMSLGEDLIFGLDALHPLYKDNGKPIGDVVTDAVSQIDVKSVLKSLVSHANGSSGNNLEKRCWVALTSDCIGRGGEFRFQSYDDWIWHPAVQVLDIKWKEMKTINTYTMGIVPDLIHWLFDFYHCFGSYYMVENGLMRTERQVGQGRVNAVFPSLFETSEAGTTRKLTRVIRNALCGSSEVKNRYSARSLRYGAMTELALHRELSIFEGCARSGHSTGTTVDDYVDEQNPGYGLKAGMARCGYNNLASNLREKIQVPRLEALGVDVADSADRLLCDTFIVNVPHFKKGEGKLHAVLRVCLASLILYYPDVAKECGGCNVICKSLNNAARNAKVHDSRFGNISPEALLVEWSKIIADDLAKRRMSVSTVNPDLVSIASAQTQLLTMVTELTKQVHSLATRNTDLENKIAAQSSELASLQEASRKSAIEFCTLKTPQQGGTKRSQDSGHNGLIPTALFGSDGPLPVSSEPPKKRLATDLLKSKKINRERIVKKADFLDLLVDHKDALFERKIHNTPIASDIAERSALRYCFELLDYVVRHDETAKTSFQIFKKKETSREEYLKLGRSLVDKCMDQLYVFEGKQPEVERKIGGRKHNTSYRGIGERVGAYKNELIKLQKEANPNLQTKKSDQPLKLKSEVQSAGTPPGTRSVASFFRNALGRSV
jgi:hypothetical protein